MFQKYRKFKEEQIEKDEELRRLTEEKPVNLEKNDTLAIIIAALTTILPVAILMFAILMGIMWLIFT